MLEIALVVLVSILVCRLLLSLQMGGPFAERLNQWVRR